MKDLSKYYTPIDENQYTIQDQKIYTEFYDDNIEHKLTETQRQIVEKMLGGYQESSSVTIKWVKSLEFSGSIKTWVGYSLYCDEITYLIGEDDWFWVRFISRKDKRRPTYNDVYEIESESDRSKCYKCDGFGGFVVFLKNHLDMIVNRM